MEEIAEAPDPQGAASGSHLMVRRGLFTKRCRLVQEVEFTRPKAQRSRRVCFVEDKLLIPPRMSRGDAVGNLRGGHISAFGRGAVCPETASSPSLDLSTLQFTLQSLSSFGSDSLGHQQYSLASGHGE